MTSLRQRMTEDMQLNIGEQRKKLLAGAERDHMIFAPVENERRGLYR